MIEEAEREICEDRSVSEGKENTLTQDQWLSLYQRGKKKA